MENELEDLIDEVRLLFHALVKRGEALHGNEAITIGERAVLEFLQREGPAPVPQIARRRGVSRQHVQTLVNPLIEAGLLEAAPNPAHKRSPLMRLTRKGETTIVRMKEREGRFARRAKLDANAAELARAARTLRELRRAIGD